MSRYFTAELSALEPYTPGEQPQNRKYIKLNTNESPYPPAPGVADAVAEAAARLALYPDPESGTLIRAAADWFGVEPENILCGNGSDENLMLAIRAFCGKDRPLAFADVTYGFYPVWCQLFGIPQVVLPLKEDFTIDPRRLLRTGQVQGGGGPSSLPTPTPPPAWHCPPRHWPRLPAATQTPLSLWTRLMWISAARAASPLCRRPTLPT